ncbi:MAG: TetR/AcrR family transcriptional regulator [Chitinophagaceae bacterium]
MDKKEHIIQKAIELFSEWGFDNTTIREISQKANVNVAMINYYFGSKIKLFESIIEYKSTYLKTKLEELQANVSLNEMDKINVIIEEYTTKILSNPRFHKVMHQELLLKTRPDLIAIIKKLFDNNYKIIKRILEDGIEKNIFRTVDPSLTISTMFGTINHFMQNSILFDLEDAGVTDFQNDEMLRKRLVNHLQQLMKAHLLKDNKTKE